MDAVQKNLGTNSCPTPVDGEIDWLLDQLSQGLDSSNALTLISRLIDKLDAKTLGQADQCAQMRASRCNRTLQADAATSPTGKPFVAFSPPPQALEASRTLASGVDVENSRPSDFRFDVRRFGPIARKFGPEMPTPACCDEARSPDSVRSNSSFCSNSSFQRFLEDSDSDSDCCGARVADEFSRPAAESLQQTDMPEFSDALSSISNAPSELMSEIPEEILEVESVVSADFGTTASKHAVPPVQWFCMSGTPSEISEDIEAEDSVEDDLYSDHAVFGEVETALSSDDSSQQSNHTSCLPNQRMEDTLEAVEVLLHRLQDFESRCSELEQRCADSREEVRSTRKELCETQDELRQARLALSTLRTDLAQTQDNFLQASEELSNTRAELSQTQDELLGARLDLSKLQTDIARTQARFSEHQDLTASAEALTEKTRKDSVESVAAVETLNAVVETSAVVHVAEPVENATVSVTDSREVEDRTCKASVEEAHDSSSSHNEEKLVIEGTESAAENCRRAREVVLKISHQGHLFRVRAPSSELEFVKELIADSVGRKPTTCELAVVSKDGEKHTLSTEVWHRALLNAEPQGPSSDAPIVVRVDVQDLPETVAADAVPSPRQSENLDDCIEQQFEFASHREDLDFPGYVHEDPSARNSAQRLASQLSSGLWSAVSIFRARVNLSL